MPICEVCVDHNQLSKPIALNSLYWCFRMFLDLENVQHLEEGVAVMIASGRWQVIFPYIIKNRDPQNHFTHTFPWGPWGPPFPRITHAFLAQALGNVGAGHGSKDYKFQTVEP